jgi:hypothetical protein
LGWMVFSTPLVTNTQRAHISATSAPPSHHTAATSTTCIGSSLSSACTAHALQTLSSSPQGRAALTTLLRHTRSSRHCHEPCHPRLTHHRSNSHRPRSGVPLYHQRLPKGHPSGLPTPSHLSKRGHGVIGSSMKKKTQLGPRRRKQHNEELYEEGCTQ